MNRHFLQVILLSLLALRAGGVHPGEAGSALDGVSPGFELTGPDGALVTLEDFRGSHLLLAFGFTNCRHVCPTMVMNMGLALKLAPEGSRGVFISVDTERDTPEVAHAYAQRFHPAITGLGGSHGQVQDAARNFGISYVVTKSQKAYTVEHTSDIFVIDPEGRLTEVFAMNAPPAEIAAAMGRADGS